MIRHYDGELGTFDYDDTMWEITNYANFYRCLGKDKGKTILHFKNSLYNGGIINIPSGITDLNHAFLDCKFNGDTTIVFDNSYIVLSCYRHHLQVHL